MVETNWNGYCLGKEYRFSWFSPFSGFRMSPDRKWNGDLRWDRKNGCTNAFNQFYQSKAKIENALVGMIVLALQHTLYCTIKKAKHTKKLMRSNDIRIFGSFTFTLWLIGFWCCCRIDGVHEISIQTQTDGHIINILSILLWFRFVYKRIINIIVDFNKRKHKRR